MSAPVYCRFAAAPAVAASTDPAAELVTLRCAMAFVACARRADSEPATAVDAAPCVASTQARLLSCPLHYSPSRPGSPPADDDGGPAVSTATNLALTVPLTAVPCLGSTPSVVVAPPTASTEVNRGTEASPSHVFRVRITDDGTVDVTDAVDVLGDALTCPLLPSGAGGDAPTGEPPPTGDADGAAASPPSATTSSPRDSVAVMADWLRLPRGIVVTPGCRTPALLGAAELVSDALQDGLTTAASALAVTTEALVLDLVVTSVRRFGPDRDFAEVSIPSVGKRSHGAGATVDESAAAESLCHNGKARTVGVFVASGPAYDNLALRVTALPTDASSATPHAGNHAAYGAATAAFASTAAGDDAMTTASFAAMRAAATARAAAWRAWVDLSGAPGQ